MPRAVRAHRNAHRANRCDAAVQHKTVRAFQNLQEGSGSRRAGSLSLTWVVLGVVGWLLGLLFVLVLMRMAGDEDRAARHEQKRIDPYSDVTITRSGIA